MNTEPTWSDSPIHEQIRTMSTDTPETFKSVMWSELGWTVDIDFARKLERERDEAREELATITEQRDEARVYADKLAEGLPEGMLPKDVEVLREANLNLATNIAAVTEQRDRLAEALRELCIALLTDKSPDITDLLNKAGEAMAAVNYSTAKKSQP